MGSHNLIFVFYRVFKNLDSQVKFLIISWGLTPGYSSFKENVNILQVHRVQFTSISH